MEKVVEKVVEVESKLKTADTDSALQFLSIIQQESRLIDFLMRTLLDLMKKSALLHESFIMVEEKYYQSIYP